MKISGLLHKLTEGLHSVGDTGRVLVRKLSLPTRLLYTDGSDKGVPSRAESLRLEGRGVNTGLNFERLLS